MRLEEFIDYDNYVEFNYGHSTGTKSLQESMATLRMKIQQNSEDEGAIIDIIKACGASLIAFIDYKDVYGWNDYQYPILKSAHISAIVSRLENRY